MEGNTAVQTLPAPDGSPLVDARGLHGFLGVKDQFNQWIRRSLDEYGFEAGADFSPVTVKTGGRTRKDYHLTLDMAKELAMVERSEMGRKTRHYFIEMEKAAREMAKSAASAKALPTARRAHRQK